MMAIYLLSFAIYYTGLVYHGMWLDNLDPESKILESVWGPLHLLSGLSVAFIWPVFQLSRFANPLLELTAGDIGQ